MLRAHTWEKDVNDQDFVIFSMEYSLFEFLESTTQLAMPGPQIE